MCSYKVFDFDAVLLIVVSGAMTCWLDGHSPHAGLFQKPRWSPNCIARCPFKNVWPTSGTQESDTFLAVSKASDLWTWFVAPK